MKMKSIFLSMLAIAALASCSNDNDVVDNGIPVPEQGPGAYLSVAINMPSSVSTRATGDAGPGSEAGTDGTNGTKNENAVKKVYLLTYKGNTRVGELRPLTNEELGTVGVNGTTAIAGNAIKVDKEVNSVFVVINPSVKTLSAITLNANKSALTTAIEEEATALMVESTGFMMTSDSGFVAVTPQVAAGETTAAIEAAQKLAKDNPIKIGVDRVVAKTKLAAFVSDADNTTNGTASVDGWKLNTTNTKYFPYAELVKYQRGGADVDDAKYRIDPNYTALAMNANGTGDAATEFTWLTNKTDVDWNNWTAPKDIEYCLENTMDAGAANQNYNNTTKMIIKAQFAPAGVTLGNSWFRVGGVVLTFDELNASYAKASDTDKAKYSEFLDRLLDIRDADGNVVTPRTKGWKGEGKAEVALSDLDGVANGGYLAATVTDGNYLIEYFQKSVCYYDVNLKHDNRVEAFKLGRWGVVRNNAYTVTINKISQPGLPYIPDPTDPDIVDPSNPDPEKPTPDDKESAFISVSITVNNWTTWSQGVDL